MTLGFWFCFWLFVLTYISMSWTKVISTNYTVLQINSSKWSVSNWTRKARNKIKKFYLNRAHLAGVPWASFVVLALHSWKMLTLERRSWICGQKDRNRNKTRAQLIEIAAKKFKLSKPPSFSAITRILRRGKRYYDNLIGSGLNGKRMNRTVFESWLKKFDEEMARQNRKVLLLVDNASPHFTEIDLTNVNLQYLPKNTTSKLQPLDSGIIASFKKQFWRLRSGKMCTIDDDEESILKIYQLDLKSAMETGAWNNVNSTSIANCWRHCNIVYDIAKSMIPLSIWLFLSDDSALLSMNFDN